MVTAMSKALGVDKTQARDRLNQQDEMTKLNVTLSKWLDDSWSAGTWLDKNSGKLVVAVTNEKRAAEVRQRNAEPRLVKRSGQNLGEVRAGVDRSAA